MTTLVTGASGFVGAAVARALAARGRPLRLLLRPGSDRRNLAGIEAEVTEGDLTDAASLHSAMKGCRRVFHLAADYRLWTPRPEVLYEANVEGSRTLVQAALEAGVERIVYTSSVATLGTHTDGGPADEATPVALSDMIGHYKRSKFLAEEAVTELVEREGAPVVIVNPSTPVGPGDIKPTPTGRMIVEAAAGRMPAFVDTGLNLVHVEDVAEGHLLAEEKGQIGARYILGGEDMTLSSILGEIAGLCGRRPPRVKLPRAPLMPLAFAAETWARMTGAAREPMLTRDGLRMSRKKMYFSSARARTELGYETRPARQGLADAIDWFRDRKYL